MREREKERERERERERANVTREITSRDLHAILPVTRGCVQHGNSIPLG